MIHDPFETRWAVRLGGRSAVSFEAWTKAIDGLNAPDDMKTAFADLAALSGSEDETAPWEVAVSWRIDGGSAVPVAVELRSLQGEPVNAAAWREVKVAEVIRETRDRLQYAYGRLDVHLTKRQQLRAAETAARASKAIARSGRPFAKDESHYEVVADLYNAAVSSDARNPVRIVAAKLSESLNDPQLLTDTRTKKWVDQARKRGLITAKPAPGRPTKS